MFVTLARAESHRVDPDDLSHRVDPDDLSHRVDPDDLSHRVDPDDFFSGHMLHDAERLKDLLARASLQGNRCHLEQTLPVQRKG